MGLPVLFALTANGVGISAALAATYGVVGGALISLAASSLLNAALTSLLTPTGAQQDIRQRIARQTELPFKRHVRGRCFATGTPSPGVSKDGFYYVSYLLNSRESEGNFEIYLDNRVVQADGDPYDLTGDGAAATNGLFDGHVTYWIGRGDQTTAPDAFVSEAGVDVADPVLEALGYKSTDAGQGCTIVWLKLQRGSDGTFQDRWPGYPFVNLTVLGDWSKVWDPRDPAQSPTDTSTHTFSRNQALQGLDLAMRNPFRPYSADLLELDMWRAAADVADEIVPLQSGGSEPRYRCDGTTLFDGSELEVMMDPIMRAGASSIVRSGGRLGIVPGAPKNIAATISDMTELPTVSSIAEPERQFDEVRATYAPLERDGEPASLRPWPIPGVVASGLPRVLTIDYSQVSSATQAMRLRKIDGLRTTYQRALEGTAFPEIFAAVSGSWITVDLGYTKLDGTFEVQTIAPMASPSGDGEGMAYRMPLALVEASSDAYDWVPASDEEDVDFYEFVYDEGGVNPPGSIAIETGDTVNLDTGGGIIPRVRYEFAPSTSSNISSYQVQVTEQGESFTDSFSIDAETADADGDVFNYFNGVAGQPYDLRARALTAAGFSDWVEFSGATPVVNITLDIPTIDSATGGAGQIDLQVTAPNDNDVRRIEVFESDTDDELAAVLFFEADATNNQVFTPSLTGLGAGETKFFFARVRGDFASASDFTASTSATTDP